MRNTALALAAAVALISAGCATNPARHLEANNDDVEITPDGSFIRGNEHLDEEEFYTLVGDAKSSEHIHEDRAQGEMFQPLGIGVGVAGVALAVGGFGLYYLAEHAGDAAPGAAPPKVNDGVVTAETYGGYIGMLGGLAGAVGGGYLWFDGHDRALGTKRLFDDKHANASLETARYGSGGATQSTVASLELKTKDGAASFCSIGSTALMPLKARDDKKRGIKLDEARNKEWFTWTTNPSGVLEPMGAGVNSPLGLSLAELGKDIIIDVKVNAPTSVATQLVLKPNYGCPKPFFNFEGGQGPGGSGGEGGQSAGGEGASGGPGGNGGGGADGQHGLDVDVEAVAFTGPNGEQLVLAAVQTHGQAQPDLALFDPKAAGRLFIDAGGGPGGTGGGGGSGGSGWSYGSGDTCRQGGNGGNGGVGGNGGRGGDGGSVKVRADSKETLAALEVNVNGGGPGQGGSGGYGGSGGSGDSCPGGSVTGGAGGAQGPGGAEGTPGRQGRADLNVAPKSGLRMIQHALSTVGKGGPSAPPAPAAPGDDAPPAKKAKKKPK